MDSSFFDDGGCRLVLPRIEIPKGFKLNHQSVGKSVSFRVGRKFQKFILCFVFQSFRLVEEAEIEATCFVDSNNGFSKEETTCFNPIKGGSKHLCIRPVYIWEWAESNPSEQNQVLITIEIKHDAIISSSVGPKITWLGVHVDCICCP